MRVLLAVSDRNARELVVAHLRDRGHEVEFVSNGLGCILNLQDAPADAIILEQGILWGGSEGVMSRMKEIAGLAAIPIVLLSCDPTEFDNDELLIIKATLRMPMKLEDLFHLRDIFDAMEAPPNRSSMNRVVEQGVMQ